MRFESASLLWLLIVLPLLGALAALAYTRRRRRLRQFVSGAVLPRLVRAASPGRDLFISILRLSAMAMCVVALARPQWGRRDEPVVRRGVDVVFALDLSSSMLAEDVVPNRLEEAKAQARSLLDSLTGDRVALVVFGGRAAVQCPLTLDYGAVRLFLDAAEPDFSPGPGSDVGRALDEATGVFNASERRYKTIVLFSDGEDLEGRGVSAAKRAHEQGVIVHAIGVGTTGGGPIPLRDDSGTLTGYKKDHEGRVVTTRFDPTGLETIALGSGGLFLPAGRAGEEGRKIADTIAGQEKRDVSSRLATRYEDRFQIPLAIALGLLAVEALWPGRRFKPASASRSRGQASARTILRTESMEKTA